MGRKHNKVINELKYLVYKQIVKHKSWNIRKKLVRLDLKKIAKKQNLSNKDVEEIKRLNNLTTHGIKKLAKIRGIKNYDD